MNIYKVDSWITKKGSTEKVMSFLCSLSLQLKCGSMQKETHNENPGKIVFATKPC